ncbi:MAG: Fur family transcriptional regulator [Alphaproteobacteria bacterium]|nr:Fur family transcriptional regulator [Alphaproteobacteria bacterium]
MDFDEFIEILKGINIKITPARLAILSIFDKAEKHLSIDEIYMMAKKDVPNLGIATTYRTVKLLCDAGIIEKHNFEDCETLYEKKTVKNHSHIIDMESKEVEEFTSEKIKKAILEIAQDLGYDLVNYRLELYCHKK